MQMNSGIIAMTSFISGKIENRIINGSKSQIFFNKCIWQKFKKIEKVKKAIKGDSKILRLEKC